MQASTTRCLSQARINWEVAAERASGIKLGNYGCGALIVRMGWRIRSVCHVWYDMVWHVLMRDHIVLSATHVF